MVRNPFSGSLYFYSPPLKDILKATLATHWTCTSLFLIDMKSTSILPLLAITIAPRMFPTSQCCDE